MGHSQEDLDRIERIASQNRALNNTDDQSRKATATLMEIERNRQLILVQQGAQVLEYERKKVAELKRRVQDQVRAQWEERRSMEQQQQPVDREVNCHSLNSVGSSEESRSSLTGSDAPTERLIDAHSPSTASSFNRFLFFYTSTNVVMTFYLNRAVLIVEAMAALHRRRARPSPAYWRLR